MWRLAALGALLAAVWLIGLRAHQATEAFFVACLVYLVAVALALRLPAPTAPRLLGLLFGFGALFRLIACLHDPQLSDDVYRYVWDGRVQAAGINPYLYPPSAPELAGLRDTLWAGINHKEQPTPYPPLAELYFAAVYRLAPESVRAMQVAAATLDLLVGAALVLLLRARGLPTVRALVWLWSPSPILHFAHSGHYDPLMLLPLLLALSVSRNTSPTPSRSAPNTGPNQRQGLCSPRAAISVFRFGSLQRWGGSGGSVPPVIGGAGGRALSAPLLALAVLAKLVPLLLAPLFLARWRLAGTLLFGAALAAGYLPYLGAGPALGSGVVTEGGESIFNDGAFWVIRQLVKPFGVDPVAGAKVVVALALVALAAWFAARNVGSSRADVVDQSYGLLGTYVALGAVVEPWYAAWLLPFVALALRPGRCLGFTAGPALGWLLFSGLVELSDLTYLHPDVPYIWTYVRAAEWLPLGALAAWPLAARLAPRPRPVERAGYEAP